MSYSLVIALCLLVCRETIGLIFLSSSDSLRSIRRYQSRLYGTGVGALSPSAIDEKSGALGKLYRDLQDAKTRRAELEKTLLMPGKELQEEVMKLQAKSGTGFSALTSNQMKAEHLAAALRQNGVIRVNNSIKKNTASALREYIIEEITAARAAIDNGEVEARFLLNMEPERKKRTDFQVSLLQRRVDAGHPVADALSELFGDAGCLRHLYEIIAGKDGKLFELACMTTEPGSERQMIHTDYKYVPEPPLYSIFVALQDVSAAMGPTVFLPKTNNAADNAAWMHKATYDDYLKSKQPFFALLKAGDLIVYDPRVLHCGAANELEGGSTRALFNVGFTNPKVTSAFGYKGSLRSNYEDKLTFRDLTKCLAGYKSGGKDPFTIYGNGLFGPDGAEGVGSKVRSITQAK